jgi:hypothetical protein
MFIGGPIIQSQAIQPAAIEIELGKQRFREGHVRFSATEVTEVTENTGRIEIVKVSSGQIAQRGRQGGGRVRIHNLRLVSLRTRSNL